MFINSGMYIAATVFFITSTVFGLIATLLCLWNTTTNPINTYLSIFGIHIYNGITSITITLGIILWGVIYADTLAKNVCIQTTITGAMTSDGYANLGYSFWYYIIYCINLICMKNNFFIFQDQHRLTYFIHCKRRNIIRAKSFNQLRTEANNDRRSTRSWSDPILIKRNCCVKLIKLFTLLSI